MFFLLIIDGFICVLCYQGGIILIKNVLEYFENTLKKHHRKTAIIDEKKTITFEELEKKSKVLSIEICKTCNFIRKPIVVFLPKGVDSVVAFLGILYSGNFYVPMDIKLPLKRFNKIYNDLGEPFIISSKVYYDLLLSYGVEKSNIILIEKFNNKNINYCESMIKSNYVSLIDCDPVYIIYTSGSTGKPKGVVISHRGVIDYIDWAIDCFKIDSCEIIGNQAPFYFDNSTLDIYLMLATGATLVVIPENKFTFPIELMKYLKRYGVNFIFWVPSVLANIANRKILESVDIKCLKKVLFAGEVMSCKHLNYWRNKLPNVLYANLYGPTEITVDCTYYIVDREFNNDEKLPIGRACSNTNIIILNKDNELAKENEIGELCVRGSSLAHGYWNNSNKTKEVFVQNPLNNTFLDLIYKTGDLVYMDENEEIMFIGRKDSQIKHMGYRIELGEIEAAVSSLDGIYNECVLYNNEKKEITLFYEGNENINNAYIRKGLMKLLPKYMIPMKTIRLETLPTNKNGKIDRNKLKQDLYKK